MKFIPSLAFSITHQRFPPDRPLKPPGRNWAKALEKRHSVLQARRVRALDWNRHEKNIYKKIIHWFEVIGRVLQDPTILPKNVYNMDESGVMLSMPSSVKVLIGKNNIRDYRGARIKRTTVTAIECISADGRYLTLIIIWSATSIEATGPDSPPPDGSMRAPNLDIPTLRSAWSGLSRYLIPKLRNRLTRNHEC